MCVCVYVCVCVCVYNIGVRIIWFACFQVSFLETFGSKHNFRFVLYSVLYYLIRNTALPKFSAAVISPLEKQNKNHSHWESRYFRI